MPTSTKSHVPHVPSLLEKLVAVYSPHTRDVKISKDKSLCVREPE